jgi:hypothetical protein
VTKAARIRSPIRDRLFLDPGVTPIARVPFCVRRGHAMCPAPARMIGHFAYGVQLPTRSDPRFRLVLRAWNTLWPSRPLPRRIYG